MKKQTRKEKKEEEKRIIAQFEEGLKEERGGVENEGSSSSSIEPDKLHCRRCKTLMEEGVRRTLGWDRHKRQYCTISCVCGDKKKKSQTQRVLG